MAKVYPMLVTDHSVDTQNNIIQMEGNESPTYLTLLTVELDTSLGANSVTGQRTASNAYEARAGQNKYNMMLNALDAGTTIAQLWCDNTGATVSNLDAYNITLPGAQRSADDRPPTGPGGGGQVLVNAPAGSA